MAFVTEAFVPVASPNFTHVPCHPTGYQKMHQDQHFTSESVKTNKKVKKGFNIFLGLPLPFRTLQIFHYYRLSDTIESLRV
jgi:hypothetical protein